jgi:hypothetical protein
MSNRYTSALSCAVWLTAGAALAQPASPPAAQAAPSTTVSPLTVREPPKAKAIRKQAQSFVQSYAAVPNPNIDQIGRWSGPVCVQVWGLPMPEQAAKIKARVESMAQALGLPAPRADCRANVQIVFTDRPQGTMDIVARRWEPLLGYYHHQRTRQLAMVTHPIQAWYATATESDGVDVAALIFGGVPLSLISPSPRVADDPTSRAPAGCFSRFTACYKSAFDNVFIVADSTALTGKTLRLIADDMVMLALSQPKSLDGCNVLPSVIDAFAKSPCPGRDPPGGLTPADHAYLTALYSADPEGRKTIEERDIARRMAKILIEAEAVPAAGAKSADQPPSPRDP